MTITIKQDRFRYRFDGEEYTVDLDRKFSGYEQGDLICTCTPFDCTGRLPLELEIAIRADGSLIFRSWAFVGYCNSYLHTNMPAFQKENFVPTAKQIDTVNGLFSGRIKYEGLKLTPGATLQEICPIDVAAEENKTGRRIYLA